MVSWWPRLGSGVNLNLLIGSYKRRPSSVYGIVVRALQNNEAHPRNWLAFRFPGQPFGTVSDLSTQLHETSSPKRTYVFQSRVLPYNLLVLQCVIAIMDADAAHNKGIAGEYEVTSYPTIKFFPRSSEPPESSQSDASKRKKTPTPYEGGRSEVDFVEFLNEHCGTNRAVGGGLNDLAGLVPQLESHVLEFFAVAEDKRQEIVASVKAEVSKLKEDTTKAGAWYVRALEKSLTDGEAWVEKEHKRSVLLSTRSWPAN